MSRPRVRHAALGPFDGGEAILGLGATPAAALDEARAWQPHLAVQGPLWCVPITHPLVGMLLEAEDDSTTRQVSP